MKSITCERCGNDFFRRPIKDKEGKDYVNCPFCYYRNYIQYKKKKRQKEEK